MLPTAATCLLVALITPPKPPPLVIRWEQEEGGVVDGTGTTQPSRMVVDDVLIHYPEEGVWKACNFNGEAWVAPADAERRTIRVTGRVEEAAGPGLDPGRTTLSVNAWTGTPQRGNRWTPHGRSIDRVGDRFTAEVWSRGGDELIPFVHPFTADGPMVDVDICLWHYGPKAGSGVCGDAKIKVMVAYP